VKPTKGKKPERKPFGRDGPPRGYPKDQSAYADPENWRYPLHTPWHARAARRYFDEWSNRAKYTEEERAYIDSRIDEALKKFETKPAQRTKRAERTAYSPKKIDELSLEQLLRLFLGPSRFGRISEIDDSLVSNVERSPEGIKGKVKDYVVQINFKNRTILHDCQDWRNNMAAKMMCKHLGKFLQRIDEMSATDLLQGTLKNKDQWSFVAP
jgi:hypothetical protein